MRKSFTYRSECFSLSVFQTTTKTELKMTMLIPCLNTRSIPVTLPFLQSHYPQVLKTRCFNEYNQSFRKEVKSTEIGHLFEHILIEEIYEQKVMAGETCITVNGNTSWNWHKEPRGVFNIAIDKGLGDAQYVTKGMDRAIRLTEQLLALRDMPVTVTPMYAPHSQPAMAMRLAYA